jgi:hypothetical protein
MEVWKDIKEYEGYYQISNYGNVRSVTRNQTQKHYSGNISHYTHKGRLLKPQKQRNGYYIVDLHKNGRTERKLIHRLVATAFLKNEHNYNCINHKDSNPNNNDVDNLEWCTQKYNIKYAYDKGTKTPPHMKAIRQIKDNVIIAEYNSIADAQRKTGIWWTNISKCCRKERNYAGGYKWEYIK